MFQKPLMPGDYPYFDYRRFTFSLGIEVPEGIWLSGCTAVRHDPRKNSMVVDGDLIEQANIVFDKLRLALHPSGRTLRDLTRLVRYVTPEAVPDLSRLDAHQQEILDAPHVSTIVVNRLLRGGALIEMEASIASEQQHEEYFPPGPDDAIRKIHAIQGGDRASRVVQFFTPGQVPVECCDVLSVICPSLPSGGMGIQFEVTTGPPESLIFQTYVVGDGADGGIVEQCRNAYRRLSAILDSKGASMDSVIKTTEFISPEGLEEYRGTAAVRKNIFKHPFPAATGVVCEGFPNSGCQIAIEVTARRLEDA